MKNIFIKKNLILLLILFFFNCQNSYSGKKPPAVVKGFVDFLSTCQTLECKDSTVEQWNFSKDGPVNLDGDWEFYWNEFCAVAKSCLPTEPEYIFVPDNWNSFVARKSDGKSIGGKGYATYRLQIRIDSKESLSLRFKRIFTAYKLYINGQLYSEVGQVSKSKTDGVPKYEPQIIDLPLSANGILDLQIHVSNYHHRRGGIGETIQIGTKKQMQKLREESLNMSLFLAGSLLIMGLYHFGLFLLRKKDLSTFYFGLYCMCMTVVSLLSGEYYLYELIPKLPYRWGITFELFSYCAGVSFFTFFIRYIFPKDIHVLPIRVIVGYSIVLSTIILFFPPEIFTLLLPAMFLLFLLCCFYVGYVLILSSIRKRDGAIIFLIGFYSFFIFIFNDILFITGVIQTGQYGSFGFFLFILFQSFFLSTRFSQAFFDVEQLSEDLNKTNHAYSYFVPTEFLQLLNIEKITDIKLGDLAERELTILFSDIRNFTQISEEMSPRENFEFINSYLKAVSPYIVMNRGFIDKFIGDAIMAIFPEKPYDAIDAAIEMLSALDALNENRKIAKRRPIAIGIGIHGGNTIIGTVGAIERMEGTVISDVVNLASRLESLTKVLGAKIIVSESTFSSFPPEINYSNRYLGEIPVKGKKDSIKVREILCGKDELTQLKIKSKEKFELAVSLFFQSEFTQSQIIFNELKEISPNDLAVQYYLEKIVEMKRIGYLQLADSL